MFVDNRDHGGDSSVVSRRGYYIYGRNFFILPNKYWSIQEVREQDVVLSLREADVTVNFPMRCLQPTLRKPADSAFSLNPSPEHYAVTIPPESKDNLPAGIVRYIETTYELEDGEITAEKYWTGHPERWYAHLWEATSQPFGPVILPEKFRPYQRGVSAHYLSQNEGPESQIAVPVSFYTRGTGDSVVNRALVAWYNSTFGLVNRYEVRAWLGQASERLSGTQFDQKMLAPDPRELDGDSITALADMIAGAPDELPTIEDQVVNHYVDSWREQLDDQVLEVFSVEKDDRDEMKLQSRLVLQDWIDSIQNL